MESVAADTAAPAAPAPDSIAGASASLHTLVRDSGEYARALGQLLASEAELAKVNLLRILAIALIVPAIAAGAVLGLDAMFAALLVRWIGDWAWAIGAVALFNVVLLACSFVLLRAWWRTLSLPRSRAAIAALWERP
jgi:hypothetical protein